jgi:3-oxoacyl-[acyl-carrier-protein] synthase-3
LQKAVILAYILQYSNIAILFYLNNNHMYHSKIVGLGFYVPSNVVTNDDLSKIIDTNDEWIQENRDSRKKTHNKGEDTTTTMGVKAEVAIARSGLAKEDIDFVVLLLKS